MTYRRWWGKLSVRRAAALAVTAASAGIQVYFSRRPLPVDLEKIPITAELGQHEVVVEGLTTGVQVPLLLSHTGRPYEVVDAHFDQARLSIPGFAAPPAPGPLSYLTQDLDTGEPGGPCRTSVQVEMKPSPDHSARLRLSQRDSLPADYRAVEFTASQTELVVRLITAGSPQSRPGSPGCRKILSRDPWTHTVSGPVPIAIAVVPDSNFRFRFQSVGQNPTLSDRDIFAFGPLEARRVDLVALASRGPFELSMNATDARSPLRLAGLQVAPDRLLVKVLGDGWVYRKGRLETYDLLERLRRYPFVASLLAVADATLLGWLKTLFLPASRARKRRRKRSRSG